MNAHPPDPTRPPAAGGEITHGSILASIRALRPILQSRSEEIDEARRLPDDIVDALRRAGLFRMMMPRAWGGPEMNPMQVNEAIEELAIGNASVAWCVMIQNDSGQYSGLLDDKVARELYPRLDMATSNVVQPRGRARTTDGGYLVSGRWPFASGCLHADWFAGGCHVIDGPGDQPKLDRAGAPLHRMALIPRDQLQIHDTWYTTGLRGTGSNDVEVRELFVPAAHTFSFNLYESTPRKGALYFWPAILNTKMPGVPLGIARSAIETVVATMRERKERSERVALAVADAHTRYASARAYVHAALERLWARLSAGQFPDEQERIAVFLSRANAFTAARDAVQLMYDALGGSAIYTRRSPLDRHLRDVSTACQHILAQRRAQQAAAELMLGALDKPFPFL